MLDKLKCCFQYHTPWQRPIEAERLCIFFLCRAPTQMLIFDSVHFNPADISLYRSPEWKENSLVTLRANANSCKRKTNSANQNRAHTVRQGHCNAVCECGSWTCLQPEHRSINRRSFLCTPGQPREMALLILAHAHAFSLLHKRTQDVSTDIILFLTDGAGSFAVASRILASNVSCDTSLLAIVHLTSMGACFLSWLKKAGRYILSYHFRRGDVHYETGHNLLKKKLCFCRFNK